MSQLDDIKARVEGHTPGPWVYHPSISRVEDVPEFDLHRFDIMAIDIAKVQESHKDGELIAAAPKLLAALEAVEAQLSLWDEQFSDDANSDDRLVRVLTGAARKAISEALA